ncbi:MAG TPA: ornithine cyclodeaminase [Chloroflexi bacterium]|nr:ornithine cyclodeaminase [Chloroflexota bacterium]
MQLRVLSADHVRAALPMPAAIEAMREAFAQLAQGQAEVPLRTPVRTPAGVTLFMPGYLAGSSALAQKIVSIYPGNQSLGLPSLNGLVIVLDPATGFPRAILDGGTLTAIRTGAASGLATDLLARPESSVLALFGAGGQAYDQVTGVRAVRPLQEVRIVSAHGERCVVLAERLQREGLAARSVRDPGEAVRGAAIIACATTSHRPLFRDEDVAPGTHINAVGAFTPEMQEVPPSTVARASVVIDQLEAALAEAGDLLKPLAAGLIEQGHFETTLGEVVLGQAPGRRSPEEITLFKSVGLAAQDVAAASRALARAEAEDLGVVVTV